ncbi:MAG: ABC transporter ATP-binding protein [Gemmatimonadota bacterium]|nr:MAG: ABC transporter ATP-binding protein [Gemmatimonadota bacterium]
MSHAVLLEARHVAKSFGRRRVLTDATLAVGPGELIGVTGENGSGKTTLLKILARLLRPDAGEFVCDGRLGYCPQAPLVFERLSVTENFAFFAAAYGLEDWPAAMARWADRLRFEPSLGQLVGELSGGTRQKLNLALALMHEPEVLLLDEPYAGFDWETYLGFWELAETLCREGRGVVVVSHFLYDRSRFDRICELVDGVLACG